MRQLRAVLRGSVLIAQLLSATFFLQGCDDEQEEESHPPAAVKDAHQVEDLAAKEDSRGEQSALDRVPIVERLPRSAHEEAWGFGRTSQSRSGPSTQLVLVNASSVKRDAKPGQGDKLLDHERAFERALMSGSDASREVHMMVADHYLQDYYKHTSTTTTTTTTTTTNTTTTTSTVKKYYKNSTGSAIDSSWKSKRTRRTTTSTTTTTTVAPVDEVLLTNVPAIKVGESNETDENLSFAPPPPPLLAEELSNERSKRLVPQDFTKDVLDKGSPGGTWSPATFSAEDAAAAARATEGSEDVTSTYSTSPVTSTSSNATTTTTSETPHPSTTASSASESPTTITTTTTTAVQILASEPLETKESRDAGELAEEARAKEEALAKQSTSTEPSDSDEDEESEDSSSASEKTEATDDDEDDAEAQSIMQLHGQPAQESYEVDPRLQAESMSRVHRLQQDRAGLLELQLRQDQQLDELRRRLQRHQEKELERFHQQQQKELEVLRLESEASQWNAMPSMDQEHAHARHRHGSRKMGQWLQEIVDSSKL